MSEQHKLTTTVEERQNLIGLWTAGIFTVIGLAFFGFAIFTLIITQQGQPNLGDYIFLPLTILMVVVNALSFFLIRRNYLIQGLWLMISASLIFPPILAVLIIRNIYPVGVTYVITLTTVLAFLVFPRVSRWQVLAAAALTTLAIIGIELWDPAFRVITPNLANFTTGVIILVTLGFLVFFIRQAIVNNVIRNKLIIIFLVVTIIPLTIIAFLNDRSSRQALTDDANTALLSAASTTAAQLDTFMIQGLDFVRAEAQLPAIVEYLSLPASQRTDSEQEARASKFITALTRQDSVYIDSIAILDIQGNTLLDTFASDVGVNKSDLSWFQKPVETGLPYVSDLEFSQTTGSASIYFSALVRDESGKTIGVFRVRYLADVLQGIVTANNNLFGPGSFAVLLNAQSHVRLAHGTTPSVIFKSVVPLDPPTLSILQARHLLPPGSPEKLSTDLPGFETALENYKTQPFFSTELTAAGTGQLEQGAIVTMKTQDWHVIYAQAQETFLAPINAQARNNLILSMVIALAVAGFAVFIAQSLSGPIVRLTQTAEKIAGGDINIQAAIESRDEIGTLAGTFNRMTGQLRDFIGTLESRVAERTRNLELAAEVGRTVSQVRALDVMLKDAAELIRAQFNLYYVQVYLINPSQTYLNLQAGTGNVGAELLGRSHRLPLNTASINGRAAIEKRSVIVTDTAASATFFPNPLLPDTRSEMAVPLLIGERVVGVLDMQSKHAGSLSTDILPAFEALAGQLAIAIQNATFLAETQQARAEVEAQARRLSRANWVDYMDAIHKPEETGFVFEQNKISPITQQTELSTNEKTLTAPIAVTGETLGNLVVEMEGQSPISHTSELVSTVARQVAQQIESLRLLDSAERYRFEAEQASRRLTREGWKDYMDANPVENLSFIYDLKEVRPFNQVADQQTEEAAFNLPIKVRDETVGKLVVQGLGSDDSEALELANAVAERLGTHIESLRQRDQTQSALAQTEKLSEASLRFARSADLQELLVVVNETLDIPVVNRALLGAMNYSPANELESLDIVANWWNGSGHEPTEIGRHYTMEMLKIMPLFLSDTPVFSNDTFHDERLEATSLELVTRQNIRSMAVLPLNFGSRQVGVLFLESEEAHDFTQDEIRLFSAMAPQIATVQENLRQFERAQQQAQRESTLNIISQKIQSATTVEAVLQIAARELGHALGAPMTIAQLSMKDKK